LLSRWIAIGSRQDWREWKVLYSKLADRARTVKVKKRITEAQTYDLRSNTLNRKWGRRYFSSYSVVMVKVKTQEERAS
jgi:hypothetical protein